MLAGKGAILGEIFTMNAKTWYKRAGEVSRDPENPNCSPELLAEVLRRGKNDGVSRYAAENPNCPIREKFLWLMLTHKNDFVFLNFLDKEYLEIRGDEEIREFVKDKLLAYIFKTYKPLSSILGDQGDQVRKLLDEFSNDFEVSILIEEMNEQVEKNKL